MPATHPTPVGKVLPSGQGSNRNESHSAYSNLFARLLRPARDTFNACEIAPVDNCNDDQFK